MFDGLAPFTTNTIIIKRYQRKDCDISFWGGFHCAASLQKMGYDCPRGWHRKWSLGYILDSEQVKWGRHFYYNFTLLCNLYTENFTNRKHLIQWINNHTSQKIENYKNPEALGKVHFNGWHIAIIRLNRMKLVIFDHFDLKEKFQVVQPNKMLKWASQLFCDESEINSSPFEACSCPSHLHGAKRAD